MKPSSTRKWDQSASSEGTAASTFANRSRENTFTDGRVSKLCFASRIPQIRMQQLVNVREALLSIDAAGKDELDTESDHLAQTAAGQDGRLHGEAEQRRQIVAVDVIIGEAF